MRRALSLARRGRGFTSPNPMVGAVLVRDGEMIASGWHHRVGLPHAEIKALNQCRKRGISARGATLFVTLEPCCTHGRTPPCTDSIIAAGIHRVIVGAIDPNPHHAGRGLALLRKAGIHVTAGVMADESNRLNEAFNHWIVHHTPFVTAKAAMTLDGKIATADGDSHWITSVTARKHAMTLRAGADAILVGIGTVLADDPALTIRQAARGGRERVTARRRIILDGRARSPLDSRLLNDAFADKTIVVVGLSAPSRAVAALEKKVTVLRAPERDGKINLRWLLSQLGRDGITSLLVEGGGEVHSSFFETKAVHRIAFYYGPKVLGGRDARKAVAGDGVRDLKTACALTNPEWEWVGPDLFVTAKVRSD
ncbi:MAG: bifunctional diaminohydroxyphosphoribosylaminopyrimidine deaminase/5-amino-6-(5-phosphoribosylamino)uracil reductase RibD [Pedosphaera sp.]|nr:bifunctional diaminohydroxyphosphoribosylaminopyrimidine deaminase/5-amino-6-(5-phosphoribosylamino)uracil reductase RibD [Pedosphaera sp.]